MPAKVKDNGSVKGRKSDVEVLKVKLTEALADKAKVTALWMVEMRKAGMALGVSAENEQLKKRLLVIDHITAGRANEAIQEILQPLPMLFTVDVRFADDKTRVAAEDEMLQRVISKATEHLQSMKIARKDDVE